MQRRHIKVKSNKFSKGWKLSIYEKQEKMINVSKNESKKSNISEERSLKV